MTPVRTSDGSEGFDDDEDDDDNAFDADESMMS